jgi:hypothetical protein
MRSARHEAILYGAATGFGSASHQKVEALTKAIDALAEELAGDPQFYWKKVAPSQSQRALGETAPVVRTGAGGRVSRPHRNRGPPHSRNEENERSGRAQMV